RVKPKMAARFASMLNPDFPFTRNTVGRFILLTKVKCPRPACQNRGTHRGRPRAVAALPVELILNPQHLQSGWVLFLRRAGPAHPSEISGFGPGADLRRRPLPYDKVLHLGDAQITMVMA